MASFGSSFPASLSTRVTLGPLQRPVGAIRYIGIPEFEQRFGCRVNSLPQNVCLMGWLSAEQCWYCAPLEFRGIRANHASYLFHNRSNESLLALLVKEVIKPLSLPSLWFAYCFYDGWRERNVFSREYRYVMPPDLRDQLEWRGAPGEIPRLTASREWVACFGSHVGDPSALLLPDLHYLVDQYKRLFSAVNAEQIPWAQKQARAVLAAGDHGNQFGFVNPPLDTTMHPRRAFRAAVESAGLDIDVFLGKGVSRSQQIGYRMIVDVDGFARTWDAWAWKMLSGSVVLAVDSIWESFFSQAFVPWEHFVPVAHDCSDLAEKFEWCQTNDAECAAIAARARAQALQAYAEVTVGARLRESFTARLAETS